VTNKTLQVQFLQLCYALGVTLLFATPTYAASDNDADTEVEVAPSNKAVQPSSDDASSSPAKANAAPLGSSSVAAPEPAAVAPTVAPAPTPTSAAAAVAAPTAAPAATLAPAPAPVAKPAPPLTTEARAIQSLTEGYKISGYFQSQYESHQDSDEQLRQGGALLNQNRFLLRRGRVRIGKDWDYASLLVEFDGNTVRGPAFRWQKAEVSLVYGRSDEKGVDPLVQFTMGMFDLPFGYELVESPKFRPFMERTTGSRALWPSEPDAGARLSGQLKFLRYAVSLTNGEPLDEKSGYGLQDPNKNKDVTVRLGAVTKPWKGFRVSGDVTYNVGKGFHAGTDATKTTVTWADENHDGIITANELKGNAGSSATPSSNFSRWAVGADAQISFETPLGRSMLYGEIVAAQNMDRGLFISDPVAASGQNIRQLHYYVAFIQELTQYALIGFRTAYYDPNADIFEFRAGKLLPTSQKIRDYSPMVGLVLPERARLLLEYDIQSNLLGRDSQGVPARYPNNLWTLRLQVNL